MTRNMRNFWFETDIDGMQKSPAFGARAKAGCNRVYVYQDVSGLSKRVLDIYGSDADDEENIELTVRHEGKLLLRCKSNRQEGSLKVHTPIVGDSKDLLKKVLNLDIPANFRLRLIDYLVEYDELPVDLNDAQRVHEFIQAMDAVR